jgi:arsenate reductase
MELLIKKGEALNVVQYLDTPPDRETLEKVLRLLGLEPRELMRQGEAIYKQLNLADDLLSREELISAMLAHPILIERPIVIKNNKAAIGRPLKSVIDIL